MATMIFSGDAAAYALAEHVGNGNAQRFLGVMNARAEEVGLRETGFENPVGFDARGHHTSARDLAEVTAWRWRTRPFERWSRPSTRSSPRRTGKYPLPTRTGCSSSARHRRQYWDHAGGRGDQPLSAAGDERYVCVVLVAGEDRFAASIRAVAHAFAANDRMDLVVEGRRYAELPTPYRHGEKIDPVAAGSLEGLVDASPRVGREVSVAKDPPPSARPVTKLGEVVVTVGGKRVG
jgi:D-alanyl-D-alanine carboxypeptidase (penicillin-binding protein 5/6)